MTLFIAMYTTNYWTKFPAVIKLLLDYHFECAYYSHNSIQKLPTNLAITLACVTSKLCLKINHLKHLAYFN